MLLLSVARRSRCAPSRCCSTAGWRRSPGPGRLPVAGARGAAAAVVIAVVVVALAAGAPGLRGPPGSTPFLNTTPEQTGSTDQRDRLTVFNNNGRVDHWNVALDSCRADG